MGKPCERCVARGVGCYYGKEDARLGVRQRCPSETPGLLSGAQENRNSQEPRNASASRPSPAGPTSIDQGQQLENDAAAVFGFEGFGDADAMTRAPNLAETHLPAGETVGSSSEQVPSFYPDDIWGASLLSPWPMMIEQPPSASPPEQITRPAAGNLSLTPSCRQLIMSILRTYPKTMAKRGALPPFVHSIGCALHYSDRDGQQNIISQMRPLQKDAAPPSVVSSSNSDGSLLLKPLEACQGVAHMYTGTSNISGPKDYVWRAIDGEEKQIIRDVSLPGCPPQGRSAHE